MAQQPKQDKKKPPKIDLTQGPDLSDEALDALSEVTQPDIIAATSLFDSKVPKLKGLLDAKVEEESK